MDNEKKPRGRPRIYATNAERKKAYRERKKAERRELEIRIKELENKLGISQENGRIMTLTYEEIAELSTETLSKLAREIGAKLGGSTSLFSIFEYFLNSMQLFRQNHEMNSKKKISIDVTEKLSTNTNNLKLLIIQYILNLELSKRKGREFLESELNHLYEQIKQLEDTALTKRNEIQIP